MNPKCIQAVNLAAGKVLTAGQIKAIDDRISSTMKRLAVADPQAWGAMPMDQRVMAAAAEAIADIKAEAARKVENAERQVMATAATEERISSLQSSLKSDRSRALIQDIDNTGHYINGMKRQYVSGMIDLVNAAKSTEGAGAGRRAAMFLFDAENPLMTKDLVNEIFANGQGGTGNKIAGAGAKAWLDTIESLRQRFNAAGGDVRKLAYGYLPQPHDASRVRMAGKDAWADKTLPLLDRKRYVNEDGRRMSDPEVLNFLRAAYDTIATEGLNKTEPGAFVGSGAKANKGGDARQIHFKDGDSYLSYMGEFGRGSMYDAMVGHVGMLARDIGLVERYGPNPNAQFRLQADLAARADGDEGRTFLNKPQAYWDLVTGVSGTPGNAQLAQIGQDIRNVQTFGKLAGAVISSLTDLSTMMVSTGYNKLSYWDLFKNVKGQASKDTRDFLTQHGVVAESMIGDLNRWAGENLLNNWSGRLANSTMKLSLMNAWTDSMRRGFAMTMMQGMSKLSQKKWGDLTEWDRAHLGRKGITEQDWDVVAQAKPTEFEGRQFLTPESIKATGAANADEVVAKVLGFITDESEYAVINPDLATRAVQTWGGQQAGTGVGELARLTMQFKSFPIAMISRHWRRMLEGDRGLEGAPLMANKAAYAAAMLVTTTALGAIVFQIKQMKDGKDPVNMGTAKFWTRAAAQGGGAGFLGDILLGDTTDDRGQLDSLGRLVMGPTFGSIADIYELTKGNVDEAIAGKQTHAGAEALRFVKGHSPYVNLWYSKAAFDHLLLQNVQESLSPGYLARVQNKAKKDWGQSYWWEPGDTVPDRAPDLSKAMP